MIENMKTEDKFTAIISNNSLPFPDFGYVVNVGEKDLVVCDVEKIDDKDYVLFCDEKTHELALYNITKTEDGFNYILVHDDVLFGKVIINIARKNDIKGEK